EIGGVNVGNASTISVKHNESENNLFVYWHQDDLLKIVKISSMGELLWSQYLSIDLGTENSYIIDSLIINENYFVIFYGYNSKLYAMKYDLNGVSIWSNPIIVSENDMSIYYKPYYEVVIDNENNLYVSLNVAKEV